MPRQTHRTQMPSPLFGSNRGDPFAEPADFEIRDGLFVSSATARRVGHDAVAEPMRQSLPIFGRADSPPMRRQVDQPLFGGLNDDSDTEDYVVNGPDDPFALLAKLFLIGVIQDRNMNDFTSLCHHAMRMIVNLDGNHRRFRTPVDIISFCSNFRQKTRYTNITYDRGRVFCNVEITDDHHKWADGHIRKIIVILDVAHSGLITRAELRDVNDKVGPEPLGPFGIFN